MPSRLTGKVFIYVAASVILFSFIMTGDSLASSSSTGFPAEGPLDTLRDFVTGPLALTLSLLGLVAAGGTLIFGGELSGFIRSMILLVLVVSVIVGAGNFMSSLFGVGAVIADLSAVGVYEA